MKQAELEIQQIKEEQKKLEEQIKNNDTLDNIGLQIKVELATLEEIKAQGCISGSSGKQRRSKKERSQSPAKNSLKFGDSFKDSFKISEKQDQDFESQNKSLAEIINFGESKKLPKNQSMTIL